MNLTIDRSQPITQHRRYKTQPFKVEGYQTNTLKKMMHQHTEYNYESQSYVNYVTTPKYDTYTVDIIGIDAHPSNPKHFSIAEVMIINRIYNQSWDIKQVYNNLIFIFYSFFNRFLTAFLGFVIKKCTVLHTHKTQNTTQNRIGCAQTKSLVMFLCLKVKS